MQKHVIKIFQESVTPYKASSMRPITCLPPNQEKDQRRQTVRMSLALLRTGAVFRRPNTRPGRRATFRPNDAMGVGRPITFAVRLVVPPANQADGAARTSALGTVESLGCPAAHPHRYRDMKLHPILFGWSNPDQALRVAAGILGKRASGGLWPGAITARGAKPSRQCTEPGSLNPG